MSAEQAGSDLSEALEHYVPGCAGHAAFTADFRTDEEREECAAICRGCRVAAPCHAYAVAARADGYWAGVDRAPRSYTRKTTEPGGCHPAPITEREMQ